jgi:NAD-dependent dihydropyrimidine dehydrogenase PreA subunit
MTTDRVVDEIILQVPFPKIDAEECKGCLRCVDACPKGCLEVSGELNTKSLAYVRYLGQGCTGCGICFYTCPEPYAIEIHRKG